MSLPRLALILPCFNPPAGWCSNILRHYQSIRTALPGIPISLTLINDGSRQSLADADIQLLHSTIPDFQYIHYPENRGKGHALRTGVQSTQAEVYVYTDLDFPYLDDCLTAIARLLLDDQYDIVAGVKGEGYYRSVPFVRKQISRLLQWLTRIFLGLAHADTQCGLKGFNEKGKKVFLETSIERYLFDLEFIYLASAQKDLRMRFHEVILREDIRFSSIGMGLLWKELRSFGHLVWKRFRYKKT